MVTNMADELHIYKTNHLWKLGTAVVVVTGRSSERGAIFADYAVLIPGHKCHSDRGRFRHWSDEGLQLDVQFLMDFAREQATHFIQAKADQVYVSDPSVPQIPVVALQEADKSVLLHMWLRDECRDELGKLADDTQSESLSQYLTLMRSISIENIG